MIYYQEEPFGQPEFDLQMSFTRQTMAQTGMAEKKDGSGFTMEEFSLNKAREEYKEGGKKAMSAKDMIEVFKNIGAEVKGQDN